MDGLGFAVAVITGTFRWIFKSLGGKRVAAILSLLFFPLVAFSLFSGRGGASGIEIGLWLSVTGGLAALSIFAMWQTRFFTVPLSACGPITSTTAWISIIGGYLILVLIFGVFIFTVMFLAAAMAAVAGSLGVSSRR